MTTLLPSRSRLPSLVAGAAAAALAALAVGLVVGGGAAPLELGDPGVLVRWGLPAACLVHDLAAACTVGLLVLATVVLPGGGRVLAGPALAATRAAVWSGLLWLAAAAVVAVLTYVDIDPDSLGRPDFADRLSVFLRDIDLGRAWLILAIGVCLAVVLAATVTSGGGAAAAAVLALVALLPLAGTGHAADAGSHETAVTSLAMHLVAVSVWVGGLAALVAMARSLTGQQLGVAAARYSTVAGWCFAGVAVSGAVNAWVRLGGIGGLVSAYGLLVLLKVGALVLLGTAGYLHRRRLLPRIGTEGGGRAFLSLAGTEVVVMAVAVALGVALSRSRPPVATVPVADLTGALGYPLPPALDGLGWVTQWRLDLFWTLVAAVAVGLYCAAARRLRLRGVRWPASRVLLWALGWLVVVYSTSGAPGAYGRVLFSAHMASHMALSMVAPLMLVMAAPATLALRALPARTDGTRGPREWILVLLHSRYLRVLSHPVVAGVLFAGSLVAFYWTSWFEWSLGNHLGHLLMTVHFLAVGYLFVWVLAGPDPGPPRPPYPMRLMLLFAVVSFHAFFGVAVMTGDTLLAPDWFAALHRPYRTDLLTDQRQGGAFAWGFGEMPTLVLALLVLLAWIREDRRETRRYERQADRDRGAELEAYNAYLASLAARDARTPHPRGDG